ncbi:hypothetical protein APY04_2329 [Hyphomicrobium sulfonivorans]|uniref:Uncharacterized protein n=1 Tax=Hyphomicrobium sulfonivorans TaxID=121290 RepID=A0A109BDD5_HYPSL|nr:hypothetical protein APY04_2329 [Hyphomicrobium sulfonivorans]
MPAVFCDPWSASQSAECRATEMTKKSAHVRNVLSGRKNGSKGPA